MKTRDKVRAVTDELRPGRWLTLAAIMDALPEPRLTFSGLAATLTRMHRDDQLRRRGSAQHMEYRSGANPVSDGRVRRKERTATQFIGFAAMARLERDDPKAFERMLAAERGRG